MRNSASLEGAIDLTGQQRIRLNDIIIYFDIIKDIKLCSTNIAKRKVEINYGVLHIRKGIIV